VFVGAAMCCLSACFCLCLKEAGQLVSGLRGEWEQGENEDVSVARKGYPVAVSERSASSPYGTRDVAEGV
jgi:hypothetical protein